MKCITCQNELKNDKFYLVKEMMYGYRDEFKYYHCSKCGCLQINNIPKDLEKYYPKDYYSYSKPNIRSNYFFNYLKKKTVRPLYWEEKLYWTVNFRTLRNHSLARMV